MLGWLIILHTIAPPSVRGDGVSLSRKDYRNTSSRALTHTVSQMVGEVEVQLSFCPADNFPVRVEHNSQQDCRISCHLAFTSCPHHQGEDKRHKQSANQLHAPPPTTSFNCIDARWVSRFRSFSLEFGLEQGGYCERVFLLLNNLSPSPLARGKQDFLGASISRPVSGYGLVAIWDIWVVIRKLWEITLMVFFKS